MIDRLPVEILLRIIDFVECIRNYPEYAFRYNTYLLKYVQVDKALRAKLFPLFITFYSIVRNKEGERLSTEVQAEKLHAIQGFEQYVRELEISSATNDLSSFTNLSSLNILGNQYVKLRGVTHLTMLDHAALMLYSQPTFPYTIDIVRLDLLVDFSVISSFSTLSQFGSIVELNIILRGDSNFCRTHELLTFIASMSLETLSFTVIRESGRCPLITLPSQESPACFINKFLSTISALKTLKKLTIDLALLRSVPGVYDLCDPGSGQSTLELEIIERAFAGPFTTDQYEMIVLFMKGLGKIESLKLIYGKQNEFAYNTSFLVLRVLAKLYKEKTGHSINMISSLMAWSIIEDSYALQKGLLSYDITNGQFGPDYKKIELYRRDVAPDSWKYLSSEVDWNFLSLDCLKQDFDRFGRRRSSIFS